MRSSDANGGTVAWVIGASLHRHGLLDGPDAANLVGRWRFELCLRVGRRTLGQVGDMSIVWEELDAMVAEISAPPSVTLRNHTAHPVAIHTAGRRLFIAAGQDVFGAGTPLTVEWTGKKTGKD